MSEAVPVSGSSRWKTWAVFVGQTLLWGLLVAVIGAVIANGYLALRGAWSISRVPGTMDIMAFVIAGLGILSVVGGAMGAPTGNAARGSSQAMGSDAYGLRQGQYVFFLYCLLGGGLLMGAAAIVRTFVG